MLSFSHRKSREGRGYQLGQGCLVRHEALPKDQQRAPFAFGETMEHVTSEQAEALCMEIAKSDPVLAETLRHVLPSLETHDEAYMFGYKNLSLRQNATILQALAVVAPDSLAEIAKNTGKTA